MISIVAKTKYALYDGDERITDFEWNSLKECKGFVVLYNEKNLVIYDKATGEQVLCVKDINDVKFEENHLYIQKNNNWGVYEYSGNNIVPIEYDYINKCIYSPITKELIAVSVDTGYEDGGYYIVATKKYVEAEEINITKTNRIELLKDGIWSMID